MTTSHRALETCSVPEALSDHLLPTVAIAGGGLAGIAAAAALGQAGIKVTLLEARHALGGRATSYVDGETGTIIDNCQHVSMGCCTNLKHLCSTLQLENFFRTEKELTFIAPDGKQARFRADPLPAPLHLLRAFWKLPGLSLADKWRFARGVGQLAGTDPAALRGVSFLDWLKEHGQPEQVIRLIWEVVLVSALSESLERVDAAYAQKVFVDGFLTNASGWLMELPLVSLDELYSTRTQDALRMLGVDVQCQSRITALATASGRVQSLLLKEGQEFSADEFILAVPHHQLSGLMASVPALRALEDQVEHLETAPITSVHLWFDQPMTNLPHAVLMDRWGQWLFARGKSAVPGGEGWAYQVVISASRHLSGMTQAQVLETVVAELKEIWPESRPATLLAGRMVTERRAVFSALPGVDRYRPAQQTPLANLQLAGDWTRTGWPSTMEGAVISGYLAADNIFKRYGIQMQAVQPPLSRGWLARLLWGK